MRLRARVDRNQPEIVRALWQAGAFVASTAQLGHGFPDIIVGYRGTWYLMEIKDGSKPPSKRRLTADEAIWIQQAQDIGRCEVHVVESVEQALSAIGAI